MATDPDPCHGYIPPDPIVIEGTLEFEEERIRKAVRKVGPLLEDVKHELGTFGVG